MNERASKCLECGGATYPILVIDRGEGNIEYELAYAAGDAKRSFLNKTYEIAGTIHGEMCESCGRIALRGVPKR